MLDAPFGERNLFVTGPGPASGGSKPGKDTRAQRPEKSGIDAAPPSAGPPVGVAVCPQADAAADVAKMIPNKRKSRYPNISTPVLWQVRAMCEKRRLSSG